MYIWNYDLKVIIDYWADIKVKVVEMPSDCDKIVLIVDSLFNYDMKVRIVDDWTYDMKIFVINPEALQK